MITKDLNQRRGSKSVYRFEAAGNLTGNELSFVVKPTTIVTDNRVVDKNSLRPGEIAVLFDAVKNVSVVTVSLIEEDTYSLNAGYYYYDLDNLTISVTLFSGIFILSADVQTPMDGMGILPANCPRAILLFPSEFEEDSFVFKTTDEGKEKFSSLEAADAKDILGVTQLEENKVDKESGKGLSELNFTQQLKNNYDSAFNDKHTHANKSNLDTINQVLSTTGNVQFAQIGIGRPCLGSWSLALNTGLSTKSGTYIDWEGGNARIREASYNLEFSGYDGSSQITAFKTGAAGNFSYRPLTTTGIICKVTQVSSNTTLTGLDNVVLVTTSTTDKTITLPVTGIPDGTVYVVKKIDSGSGRIIIQGASGTIDGQASVTLTSENSLFKFIKSGGNYFILGKII